MKSKRFLACLLAAAMLASSLAACGGGDEEKPAGSAAAATASTAAGETLADEQVITMGQPEARTLDTAQVGDTASATMACNFSEGFFRYKTEADGTTTMEKADCTDYKISDDGLTYTMTLRGNKWSDGKPVTAKDYVYAVKRLLDKDLASSYAFFGTGLVNGDAYFKGKTKDFSQVGVKALDDKTVEYKLAEPDSAFLTKLAAPNFMPLREDICTKMGSKYGVEAEGMVFCGPFKLTEWTDKNTGKLEKNDQYWDAKSVHLTQVNLQYIKEDTTSDKLFEEGELVQFGARDDFIKKYEKKAEAGEAQAIKRDYAGNLFWTSFKLAGGPSGLMKNAKIRKAVGNAIDNKDYCETLYGRYTPAYSFVPKPILLGDKSYSEQANQELWKPDYDKLHGNKTELQKLFKEGLQELGKQTNDLSKYTLTYLTYGESSKGKQVNEFIQQSIEKNLGVKVKLNVLSGWEQYGKEVEKDGWDISTNGWSPDYNEPMTFYDMWLTGGSSNFQGYASKEYDALIAEAKKTTDPAKRVEVYKKCEQKMYDDMIMVPQYFPDTRSFLQPNVRDFQINMMNGDWDVKRTYLVAEE